MCDKAVDNYALEFVPDQCKTFIKLLWKYYFPSAIKFAPKCYKTQEMCNKAVNTCFFIFDSGPDHYKTQKMCDETIDDCLAGLKFIPDWFVC